MPHSTPAGKNVSHRLDDIDFRTGAMCSTQAIEVSLWLNDVDFRVY